MQIYNKDHVLKYVNRIIENKLKKAATRLFSEDVEKGLLVNLSEKKLVVDKKIEVCPFNEFLEF